MALDFGKLKTLILAYVKRSEESLIKDGVNTLEVAINNAQLAIQRDHDFNWQRAQIYVDCSPIGNILTGAKKAVDDSVVVVKRVVKAYTYDSGFGQLVPIEFRSKDTHAHDIYVQTRLGAIPVEATGEAQKVVQQGQDVWLYPMPEGGSTRVYFDAVIYLDELVEDTDTNFLLVYARDFLMYHAIVELNFFLKDDERYQVSQTLLTRARKSLLDWDNTLVTFTDAELDL